MIIREENSYINENESVSIGNQALYDLCVNNPMNDVVNGLIAKLWIIGRSYAASPERRNYAKDYTKNDVKDSGGNDIKLDLNTGSNGTDSFFMSLSKKIIDCSEYETLKNKIELLSTHTFTYDYESDSNILKESTEVVLLFNRILRNCIEKCDEPALLAYEELTHKSSTDRNLRYFVSFSSKFIHFHLPKLVFIIDSFSFAHVKKRDGRKRNSNYIFKDNNGNLIFRIESSNIHYFEIPGYENNKEKNYIDHVARCYAIMCKIHESFHCNPTPRMLDNFIMHVNLDTLGTEIE